MKLEKSTHSVPLKGRLILQDGAIFNGYSFGFTRSNAGEVVFNTGMTGYPETLTDPSYKGQILTLTYPLIGNYGVPVENEKSDLSKYFESEKIQITGLLVSDYSQEYSHWNSGQSLSEWLYKYDIPALYGIDTRTLTKKLREKGTMLGKIEFDNDNLDFYDPNLDNLVEVKEEVDLPVLRKDFIVDEYQIHESAAYGADSILLISSCVGNKLSDFLALAKDLSLEAIVECRNVQDVKLAVDAGAKIIGVNNRDLHTLRIDLGITKQLAGYVPSNTILISESGIKTAEDIRFLMGAGANAVLIGTVLMRSKVPREKLQKFVQA